MFNTVKAVAFDFGGVLAYQDFTALTSEELFLFKSYINRCSITPQDLIKSAEEIMPIILLKLYKLSEDSISTLEYLKDLNIKTSIWTNNIKAFNNWCEQVRLDRYVGSIINSFDIGVNKPNLEFYYKALQQMRSNPSEVLFLDDDGNNVAGAKNCGIRGVLYNSNEALKDAVDKVIRKGGLH